MNPLDTEMSDAHPTRHQARNPEATTTTQGFGATSTGFGRSPKPSFGTPSSETGTLQELRERNAALEAQMQTLLHRMDTLQASVGRSAAVPVPFREPKIELGKPEKWDGNDSNLCKPWINRIQDFIGGLNDHRSTPLSEREKIRIAGSYLGGQAYDKWHAETELLDKGTSQYHTLEDFMKGLFSLYVPTDTAEQHRRKFDELTMKGTARQFLQDLTMHGGQSGDMQPTPQEMMRRARAGLKPALKSRVDSTPNAPTEYHAWVQWVINMDESYTASREAYRNTRRLNHIAVPELSDTEDDDPLEDPEKVLNAIRQSREKETRSCFYCKKPGHIARNCRKKASDKAKEQSKEEKGSGQ